MAELRICELTEYDSKGLEGIQSSDFLVKKKENIFNKESAGLVNLYRENHLVDNLIIQSDQIVKQSAQVPEAFYCSGYLMFSVNRELYI